MKHRKLSAAVLSMALAASSAATMILPSVSIPTFAIESNSEPMPGYGDNLALGKTAVASDCEANNLAADKATDGDTTAKGSRWASNTNSGAHWIYVDLGSVQDVNTIRIFWEMRKATAYKIQTATENPGEEASWTNQKVFNDRPASVNDVIVLDETVEARYVRLYIDSFTAEDPDGGVTWSTVSIYEMEVFGPKDPNYQDPMENVALNKTAVASSQEADSVKASNAVDGNTESVKSRWGSNVGDGPDWIYVDLGKEMDVQTVRLFWESYKATKYRIQTADAEADPAQEDSWTDRKVIDGRPAKLSEKIKLDEKVRARYVRLYIDSHTAADPEGTVPEWNSVSIFEMEVYGGDPATLNNLDDIAAAIEVGEVTADMTKLPVTLPDVTEDFEVRYNGTDLEQIVDAEQNIHKPLVDKTVKVSFKVVNKKTNAYKFAEIPVVIPGQYTAEEGDNTAPTIIPELQEWKGAEGAFAITENTKVLFADPAFEYAANELAADYEELTGKKITAEAAGAEIPAGSIVFKKASDSALGEEGYLLNVDGTIEITAAHPTGAYWATRTILQAVTSSEDGTIAKGIARDYPNMKLRGAILDVGRKPFTLDYLRQYTKMLSWFKMNDFHVHLNDNYIWVNEYWKVPTEDGGTEDRRLLDVYDAFRMESNIKKGDPVPGSEDKTNQRDLTATDLFYTKEDFNSFIKDSAKMGVTIVPEFDMPAHALSLTKVRPWLHSPDSDLPHQSTGGNRSSADHLDLNHQYEGALGFVKEIWDEYTTEENRVFDTPVIHIGADEYEAGADNYRKFVNDMFDYAESKGYKPRVWGSLTQLKSSREVKGYKENEDGSISRRQINIWNTGWANAKEMYDLGFELINCNDGQFYIVPNAGYYYDYLNDNTMYNQKLNVIGGVNIPAGDEQMAGAQYAIWNDMVFDKETGISEYDIYRRSYNSAGLLAANLWGKGNASLAEAKERIAAVADIPGTNFEYEVEKKDGAVASINMDSNKDASGLNHDLTLNGAKIEKDGGRNALKLDGTGYASLSDVETAGLGNSLRVKVKRTSDSNEEQVLFDSPYGQIKAVQKETGKVGVSREFVDFSFDYELPVGEWVELEFRNRFEQLELYVNGNLVQTIGETRRQGKKVTMMFPIANIGAAENSFIGYVDDVQIGTADDFASTARLERKLEMAYAMEDESLNEVIAKGYAVSGKYNPTVEEIDAAIAEIDEKLDGMEYEKANYAELDRYLLLVPEDKSVFTADSVTKLNAAIESIVRNMPKGGQESVDQMTANLKAALAGLTVDPNRSINTVNPSDIVAARASSFHSGEEADKAFDGSKDSMWHCDWDDNGNDHWLEAEFAEPTCVSELIYSPRQSGSNGYITGYEIQISNDGTNYETVKSGTLASSVADKTITLDEPVTAKIIRLHATNGAGGFASCSELVFKRGDVTPNIDALNAMIAKAEKFNEANFTADSWAAMNTALDAAKALVESTDAVAVDNATNALSKAIAGLVYGDIVEDEYDYTMLSFLIGEMTDEKVDKMTAAEALHNAINTAKALINNANSQKEVDDQTDALHNDWLDARYTPDKAMVEDLLNDGE